MSTGKLASPLLLALVLHLLLESSSAKRDLKKCTPSSCGAITNISSPFRLEGDAPGCGDSVYELACQNNRTILQRSYGDFYVEEINYKNLTVRLVDGSINSNRCSVPQNSFPLGCDKAREISFSVPFLEFYEDDFMLYFLRCKVPVHSLFYVDASPCSNNSISPYPYLYAFLLDGNISNFHESCIAEIQYPTPLRFSNITSLSIYDIYKELLKGFEVRWDYCLDDFKNHKRISLHKIFWRLRFILKSYWDGFNIFFHRGISRKTWDLYYTSGTQVRAVITTGVIIILRTILGLACLVTALVFQFRRRHLSVDDTIEEFLRRQNNLMPIRYSYSEIKAITRGFRDKLGQGGFGSVFKGKLRSGLPVAVKLLGNSKANGEDFINEVATIGRIHHINVVQLIGFCVEGSKQALIYEFMPNGSLDRIIFSRQPDHIICLSWQKMFDIALGVARGIEYLHRGCEMQILHFDIKPHNILLDANFVPKVSDFGLARLYSAEASIISLTAARGTIGYIAPELFYKNIGGVSYKADVYSFGMLLMEMVGKRKNLNAAAEQSSQVYLPSWIYHRFESGEGIELEEATEHENKIVKKMTLVAFWCIQMNPINRPSMSRVLEMLEGPDELLEMPPKPFLASGDMSDDRFLSNTMEEGTSTEPSGV